MLRKYPTCIDAYLDGEEIKYEKPFFVERDDITEKTFEDRERLCRPTHASAQRRRKKRQLQRSYSLRLYTEEQAVAEASRCLECGCHDYFECKLIDFANQYDVTS